MEALLREPPPEAGRDFAEVLAEFDAKVAAYCFRINHPRFLAFVPSAPTFVSVLGDLLCAGSNFFAGVWLEAAGAAQVELLVLIAGGTPSREAPGRRRPDRSPLLGLSFQVRSPFDSDEDAVRRPPGVTRDALDIIKAGCVQPALVIYPGINEASRRGDRHEIRGVQRAEQRAVFLVGGDRVENDDPPPWGKGVVSLAQQGNVLLGCPDDEEVGEEKAIAAGGELVLERATGDRPNPVGQAVAPDAFLGQGADRGDVQEPNGEVGVGPGQANRDGGVAPADVGQRNRRRRAKAAGFRPTRHS